jgi:hypothetical protein
LRVGHVQEGLSKVEWGLRVSFPRARKTARQGACVMNYGLYEEIETFVTMVFTVGERKVEF